MAFYARNPTDYPLAYEELRIEVEQLKDGRHQSRAWLPHRGDNGQDDRGDGSHEVWSKFRIPVQPWEVEAVSSRLVVKQSRNVSPDTSDPARDLGSRLFDAALGRADMRIYAGAAGRVQPERGLCVTVRAQDPQIEDLPWELMYDRNVLAHFVALTPGTSLVRLGPTHAPEPRPAEEVKVLVASTGPETEKDTDTVTGLLRSGGLPESSLTVVYVAGWEALQKALYDHMPTLLHLLGSGRSGRRGGQRLSVRREAGADEVTSTELGEVLQRVGRLDMVTLHGEATDRLAVDVARQVPVCVGFRELVAPWSIVTFLRELYTALWRGLPVPAAVTAGRSQVVVQSQGGADWAASVVTTSTLRPLVVPGSNRAVSTRSYPIRGGDTPVPAPAGSDSDSATVVNLHRRLQIDEENRAELLDQWSTVARPWPQIIEEQLTGVEQRIAQTRAEFERLEVDPS